MQNNVILKEVPDILVASIGFKGKYSELSGRIGYLFRFCGPVSRGKSFLLHYVQEIDKDDLKVEICVPVSKEVNVNAVTSRILKGGKAVTIIHQGPYETLGQSYKVLKEYVEANRIKTVLPSREVYLESPGQKGGGNKNKYQTEIQVLIE